MRLIAVSLVVCGFSLAGCKPILLPDPKEAHLLSKPARVHVLVRQPDGRLRSQKVEYPAGSVIATPEAIQAAE